MNGILSIGVLAVLMEGTFALQVYLLEARKERHQPDLCGVAINLELVGGEI
jgi:hypothetical protein